MPPSSIVKISTSKPVARGTSRALAAMFVLLSVGACGGSGTLGNASGSSLSIAAALDPERSISVETSLTGDQVIPPSGSAALGNASFVLDTETLQLYAELETTINDVLSVDVHEGGIGESGVIIASMYEISSGRFALPASTYLTQAQRILFENGSLYIDVHSQRHEIRGQLPDITTQRVINPVLAAIQSNIFTPRCSGCHAGVGNTLPGSMDLTSEQSSYTSLVGTSSVSIEGLLLVDPGDPEASFLFHKIQGTQTVGGRMPLRGARLDEQAIESVRLWIAQGAMR